MRHARARVALLALLILGAMPDVHAAPRAAAPVVGYTISTDTHRISGVVCQRQRGQCVDVGCAAAKVSPMTSDDLAKTDDHAACHVDVAVVLTGRVTSGGKPLKGVFLVAQAQNLDRDHCWPDTSVAQAVACATQSLRPLRGNGVLLDKAGRFSVRLPPDSYAAAGIAPVAQLQTCKTIPVRITIKVRGAKTAKQASATGCA